MNNLTTISEKEIKSITTNFSSDTGLTYSPRNLKTLDDCVEQFNKADEVSHLAQTVIKDRMQGDALLKAKKLICGDEWNANKMTNKVSSKWKDFLMNINCKQVNASYLLDFAGYKEAGGKIETASHYREVKKVSTTKTHTEIDAMYDEAGGDELGTAREVKESVQKQKVWVQPLFEKVVGAEPKVSLSSMAYGMKLNDSMPTPSETEWKSFYRTVAACVHPDKGGSQEHTALLTQLNEMYQIVFTQNKEVEKQKKWNADYKIWKEDRGYKDDFIKEDEL